MTTHERDRLVLVTGAGGFVGRAIVARLLDSGVRVRAASRNPRQLVSAMPPGDSPARRALLETAAHGDLADPRFDFAHLVDGATHVVHTAGIAHATSTIPEAVYQAVNARAPARLAEACRAAGVQRLVHLSSVRAQSGPVAASVLRESDEPRPTDAYGRAKLVGDRLIETVLADGTCDFTILRPVLVVGPGARGNLSALLRLSRLPLPLPLGAARARRSLIGLSNLTALIEHALDAPAMSRRVLLAADQPALSVAEIVTAMRTALGRRAGLVPVPAALLAGAGRLIGRADAVSRLIGALEVDGAALAATGFRAHEPIEAEIAAFVRHALAR